MYNRLSAMESLFKRPAVFIKYNNVCVHNKYYYNNT